VHAGSHLGPERLVADDLARGAKEIGALAAKDSIVAEFCEGACGGSATPGEVAIGDFCRESARWVV